MKPRYESPCSHAEHPTLIEIDLGALRDNFLTLRGVAGKSRVMAVLKANAYGHGLIPCAQTLAAAGADAFGVAFLSEALALRRAGITQPILAFGGILREQIDEFIEHEIDITASSESKLSSIAEVAARWHMPARVHLKFDTGMGRIGVRPESARNLIVKALQLKGIQIRGIYTHFAESERETKFTTEQLQKFLEICGIFQKEAGYLPLRHAANSAALLRIPEARLDLVRPGIALYGVYPTKSLSNACTLKPVMRVSSHVVYFKTVLPGASVSYGRTWTAQVPTRVVTVPVGYGDGYFRALSNRGSMLIRGKKFPIVGTVCMDQTMVAVGDDEAYVGDEVVLLGRQGDASISADEVADAAGTISYEILTNFSARVPRRYT